MPNRVTKGKAQVGVLRGRLGGLGQFAKTFTILHTMSTVTAFTLPMDAQIISLKLLGTTGSNAGSTATVSVGVSGGSGHDYLNAFSVLGSAGVGQLATPGATLPMTALTADTPVTVTYAETGAASTAGSWLLIVEYVQ